MTDISVKQRRNPECKLDGFWPGPQGSRCPILFCDVVGTEAEEETSNREGRKVMAGSKSNMKDAKKTVSKTIPCMCMCWNHVLEPCRRVISILPVCCIYPSYLDSHAIYRFKY